MKKAIILVLVLFSFTISYAQDGKPTKDETIRFISSYFSGYEIADIKIIQSFYLTNHKNNVEYLSIKNGEPDIHERMIKALLRLVTFCGKNKTF